MAKLRAVECREFIKAVVEKAENMGVPVSVAVVGPEGHLIAVERMDEAGFIDRKSTRMNSSHRCISHAVFCLTQTRATSPWPHMPVALRDLGATGWTSADS